MRAILTLLLLFALAACSDDGPTGPLPNEIAGSWSGTSQTTTGNTFSVNLTLAEASDQITGNGVLSVPGSGGIAVAATGTFSDPNFTITLSSQGYQDMAFVGAVDGDAISGTLTGSGFSGQAVSLTRQ